MTAVAPEARVPRRPGTLALALALLVAGACAPPGPEGAGGEPQVADTLTASADSAAAADTVRHAQQLVLREPVPLVLDIRSDPARRGTAEVFAECRIVPSPDGGSLYEVATTTGEFEGGPAALGLIVGDFRGPGSYEEDVTVTLVLGQGSPQPDVRAARTGCVVGVENLGSGSFSCERPAEEPAGPAADTAQAPKLALTMELVGTGTWRCP